MKRYKHIIMTIILLLTACQAKQPLIESTDTKELLQEVADDTEEGADDELIVILPQTVNVPLIPESDTFFGGYPEPADFDAAAAMAIEPVYDEDGTYGGSTVIWSTVNDGDFLHFYYSLTYPEKLRPESAGKAIIGEDIKLSCGIHVGMTAAEADAIIPGLYHFRWDNPEYTTNLDWNCNVYPQSWCRQFPQILIAEIDHDNEMPRTVGLFLDDQNIIRAIAFNVPTAG